jgi:hypothetical protein
MWASIVMIPDFRSRQPRDGPMQCGNQPADISVIHRRYKLHASRSPSGAIPAAHTHRARKTARATLVPVDTRGPYQLTDLRGARRSWGARCTVLADRVHAALDADPAYFYRHVEVRVEDGVAEGLTNGRAR